MAKRKILRLVIGGASGKAADQSKLDSVAQRVSEARGVVEGLTPRQQQVLSGITQGGSIKQIALALGISPGAVEMHMRGMMRSLRAKTTADLVRIGIYADVERGR